MKYVVGDLQVFLKAPPGFVKCTGCVLHKKQFPELFNVIGTVWNVGFELENEFRLPVMDNYYIYTGKEDECIDGVIVCKFIELN